MVSPCRGELNWDIISDVHQCSNCCTTSFLSLDSSGALVKERIDMNFMEDDLTERFFSHVLFQENSLGAQFGKILNILVHGSDSSA